MRIGTSPPNITSRFTRFNHNSKTGNISRYRVAHLSPRSSSFTKLLADTNTHITTTPAGPGFLGSIARPIQRVSHHSSTAILGALIRNKVLLLTNNAGCSTDIPSASAQVRRGKGLKLHLCTHHARNRRPKQTRPQTWTPNFPSRPQVAELKRHSRFENTINTYDRSNRNV